MAAIGRAYRIRRTRTVASHFDTISARMSGRRCRRTWLACRRTVGARGTGRATAVTGADVVVALRYDLGKMRRRHQ